MSSLEFVENVRRLDNSLFRSVTMLPKLVRTSLRGKEYRPSAQSALSTLRACSESSTGLENFAGPRGHFKKDNVATFSMINKKRIHIRRWLKSTTVYLERSVLFFDKKE